MNIMNKCSIIKCSIYKLIGSLVVSPIIYYVVKFFSKIAGVTYNITHGDAFIIWVLLAILVVLCFKCEHKNSKKRK